MICRLLLFCQATYFCFEFVCDELVLVWQFDRKFEYLYIFVHTTQAALCLSPCYRFQSSNLRNIFTPVTIIKELFSSQSPID